MRAVRYLFIGHVAALVFGLAGLLIAIPNPQLWAGAPYAGEIFTFGMTYAGSLHILLGLAAVLAFGLRVVGRRKTLIFLALSTTLSLSFELIGTGTGWPFGNYEYTAFLGFKVLGRVPYTIPLSWFYMGFCSFLLAEVIGRGRWRWWGWTVALGVWFLTVWDLVLDPAMAHESLPVKFWVWHETGPYFGMPVKNFAGWSLTGLTFMLLSRLLWRQDAGVDRRQAWLPFGVYAANMAFASALSMSVGLWIPVVVALICGMLPALLALRGGDSSGAPAQGGTPRGGRGRGRGRRRAVGQVTPFQRIARHFLRGGAGALAARRLSLTVEGAHHLPAAGPLIIACRHFHHLYDGTVLLASVPRPLSIMVALDWARARWVRRLMELACRAAGWPVVLRPDALQRNPQSAYRLEEVFNVMRHGIGEALEIVRQGGALVVFPEAYPNVDPNFTLKSGEEFLRFRPGFARLAQLAQQRLRQRIPVVPAGLSYEGEGRPRVTLRFGAPIYVDATTSQEALIAQLEGQVRALSRPPVEVPERPVEVSRRSVT